MRRARTVAHPQASRRGVETAPRRFPDPAADGKRLRMKGKVLPKDLVRYTSRPRRAIACPRAGCSKGDYGSQIAYSRQRRQDAAGRGGVGTDPDRLATGARQVFPARDFIKGLRPLAFLISSRRRRTELPAREAPAHAPLPGRARAARVPNGTRNAASRASSGEATLPNPVPIHHRCRARATTARSRTTRYDIT